MLRPWRFLRSRKARKKAQAQEIAEARTVPGGQGSVVDRIWHPPIG